MRRSTIKSLTFGIALLGALPFALLTSCDKFGDDHDKYFSTRLRINVEEPLETKVVRDTSMDLPYGITWEDGDEFLLHLSALDLEGFVGGVYSDNQILYHADCKLIRENGDWITYLKEGDGYKKCEEIQIDSLKEGSTISMHFHYDYRGDDIPPQDWWGIGYTTYADPQPGEQTVTVNLADILESINSIYSQKD